MANKPQNPQPNFDKSQRTPTKADVDTELENSDRARKARAGDEGYDIDKPQESSRRT